MKNPFSNKLTRPTRVKVGPHNFSISFVTDSNLQEKDLDGCLLYDRLAILVNAEVPLSKQAEVIVHETLHAIARVVGVSPKDDTKLTEEEICERFSPILLQVLTENSPVLHFLLKATD